MSPDQKEKVKINRDPEIPKDLASTFVATIRSCEEAAKAARRFLISGDRNDATRFMNARMVMKSMACKQPLVRIEGGICSGGHPFSDEDRQKALILLREADEKARL